MNRIAVIFTLLAVLYLLKDWIPVPLFRLPGDFEIGRGSVRLFLPIATCVLVSLVVSFLLAIFRRS